MNTLYNNDSTLSRNCYQMNLINSSKSVSSDYYDSWFSNPTVLSHDDYGIKIFNQPALSSDHFNTSRLCTLTKHVLPSTSYPTRLATSSREKLSNYDALKRDLSNLSVRIDNLLEALHNANDRTRNIDSLKTSFLNSSSTKEIGLSQIATSKYGNLDNKSISLNSSNSGKTVFGDYNKTYLSFLLKAVDRGFDIKALCPSSRVLVNEYFKSNPNHRGASYNDNYKSGTAFLNIRPKKNSSRALTDDFNERKLLNLSNSLPTEGINKSLNCATKSSSKTEFYFKTGATNLSINLDKSYSDNAFFSDFTSSLFGDYSNTGLVYAGKRKFINDTAKRRQISYLSTNDCNIRPKPLKVLTNYLPNLPSRKVPNKSPYIYNDMVEKAGSNKNSFNADSLKIHEINDSYEFMLKHEPRNKELYLARSHDPPIYATSPLSSNTKTHYTSQNTVYSIAQIDSNLNKNRPFMNNDMTSLFSITSKILVAKSESHCNNVGPKKLSIFDVAPDVPYKNQSHTTSMTKDEFAYKKHSNTKQTTALGNVCGSFDQQSNRRYGHVEHSTQRTCKSEQAINLQVNNMKSGKSIHTITQERIATLNASNEQPIDTKTDQKLNNTAIKRHCTTGKAQAAQDTNEKVLKCANGVQTAKIHQNSSQEILRDKKDIIRTSPTIWLHEKTVAVTRMTEFDCKQKTDNPLTNIGQINNQQSSTELNVKIPHKEYLQTNSLTKTKSEFLTGIPEKTNEIISNVSNIPGEQLINAASKSDEPKINKADQSNNNSIINSISVKNNENNANSKEQIVSTFSKTFEQTDKLTNTKNESIIKTNIWNGELTINNANRNNQQTISNANTSNEQAICKSSECHNQKLNVMHGEKIISSSLDVSTEKNITVAQKIREVTNSNYLASIEQRAINLPPRNTKQATISLTHSETEKKMNISHKNYDQLSIDKSHRNSKQAINVPRENNEVVIINTTHLSSEQIIIAPYANSKQTIFTPPAISQQSVNKLGISSQQVISNQKNSDETRQEISDEKNKIANSRLIDNEQKADRIRVNTESIKVVPQEYSERIRQVNRTTGGELSTEFMFATNAWNTVILPNKQQTTDEFQISSVSEAGKLSVKIKPTVSEEQNGDFSALNCEPVSLAIGEQSNKFQDNINNFIDDQEEKKMSYGILDEVKENRDFNETHSEQVRNTKNITASGIISDNYQQSRRKSIDEKSQVDRSEWKQIPEKNSLESNEESSASLSISEVYDFNLPKYWSTSNDHSVKMVSLQQSGKQSEEFRKVEKSFYLTMAKDSCKIIRVIVENYCSIYYET